MSSIVIIRHFIIGFMLGVSGGIYLLWTNTASLHAMLMNTAAPTVTITGFVGVPALIVGVGAALTGLLFAAIEAADNRPRRQP